MGSFRTLNSLLLLVTFVVLNYETISVYARDPNLVTADAPAPRPFIIIRSYTPLQKHVRFFDRNKDGLIYPYETYQGLRAIGASVTLSLMGAAFINGLLGPKTSRSKIPSPLLPIYIENIFKGKHTSDTGAFDSEGRFVELKFENIFLKHAKTHQNALTYDEMKEMVIVNREQYDTKGSFAAMTEWSMLYDLFKGNDGLLHKDTLRGVYDGTLFYNKEEERKSSAKNV